MRRRPTLPTQAALALALLLLLSGRQPAAPAWQNFKIGQVLLLDRNQKSDPRLIPYRALVSLRSGDPYRYENIRKSIENLYKTGVFAGIEARVQPRETALLDVFLVLQNKPVIRALKFSTSSPVGVRELRGGIYSLRKNDLFEESKLAKAVDELKTLLKGKGYFNAQVAAQVDLDANRSGCVVRFAIDYGKIAGIRRIQVDVNDDELKRIIPGYFKNPGSYIQAEFTKKIDKTRKLLKRHRYYFPEINVQEDFLDPQRSQLDITIAIACGYKYNFVFQGMAARMPLIADVWERPGL